MLVLPATPSPTRTRTITRSCTPATTISVSPTATASTIGVPLLSYTVLLSKAQAHMWTPACLHGYTRAWRAMGTCAHIPGNTYACTHALTLLVAYREPWECTGRGDRGFGCIFYLSTFRRGGQPPLVDDMGVGAEVGNPFPLPFSQKVLSSYPINFRPHMVFFAPLTG